MLSGWLPQPAPSTTWTMGRAFTLSCVLIALIWPKSTYSMTNARIDKLRQKTDSLFYHGFDNYMEHAFPEDELRPVSCQPLTRDRANPAHIELNDPLGNYSLTLVDSLSTLAILASGAGPESEKRRAFQQFQAGVIKLVDLYGDGTEGKTGQGSRSHGFDVDSKVQVFESVIRGVGGLLSAHLFAIGELPITGYDVSRDSIPGREIATIRWSKNFNYDGQLLRLAYDLGKRLIPAFSTSTGIPYPRVNLRYGIPFYSNSILSCNNERYAMHAGDNLQCPEVFPNTRELTETCSAGAGSLLLEFTVLSRLTGDFHFENVAKRAFWSIWERRSAIGLVGSNIDSETGLWTTSYTGLGAGIDSFFEYAMKSYILLSGSSVSEAERSQSDLWFSQFGVPYLTEEDHDPESFLSAWQQSHSAIRRHLYRGAEHVHPHYVQADVFTGATRALWMDSLSAFYPGLLTLAGNVDEAIETHLVFAALWNRYSGIPERWSTITGSVEGGLGWWLGRPEFIESTYYLYRATEDPFYLYIGEMVLKDIKRRCWAQCGLSGLQDVRTGEQNDRMESFFLGETAKYLHLLFDSDHPLNKLDAPFVFTTEGHPLLVPKSWRRASHGNGARGRTAEVQLETETDICPAPSARPILSVSHIASRQDFFHAADLARLHLMPSVDRLDSAKVDYAIDHPTVSTSGLRSPSNFTYYPWTLPLELIPQDGISSAVAPLPSIDISFPSTSAANIIFPNGMLQRVGNGILVNAMSGLRLGMVQDVVFPSELKEVDHYRIQTINNMPLGKDEKIFLAKDTMSDAISTTDPLFTRVRNEVMMDLAVDVHTHVGKHHLDMAKDSTDSTESSPTEPATRIALPKDLLSGDSASASLVQNVFKFIAQQASSMIKDQAPPPDLSVERKYFSAITSTGPGFIPLPELAEFPGPDIKGNAQGQLLWRNIFAGGQNCDAVLPASVPREHEVLVLQRGGCSFSQKLEHIPSYVPSATSLQLVVVVSYDDDGGDEDRLIRPHLDLMQFTSTGIPRRNPIPMILVGGGEATYEALAAALALGIKRRYTMRAQGVPIDNLVVL